MNRYLESGYPAIEPLMTLPDIFTVILLGPRGCGKSYGVFDKLEENAEATGDKFLYMRRTTAEMEALTASDELSPLKALNKDRGVNYGYFRASKYHSEIAAREILDDGSEVRSAGEPIGLAVALSTVAHIRGLGGEDYKYLFYDEFVPEAHVRAIKDEATAFYNAYETFNRNRELPPPRGRGEPPMKIIMAGNSNCLDSPMLMGMNLVSKIESMKRKKQYYSVLPDRGIAIILYDDSPISREKSTTAIYRLTKGTKFFSMAIENEFMDIGSDATIKSCPIREYRPLCSIGELTIYKHKSRHQYYVSTHHMETANQYDTTDLERARFRKAFGWLWMENLDGNVIFEERVCSFLLTKYMNR